MTERHNLIGRLGVAILFWVVSCGDHREAPVPKEAPSPIPGPPEEAPPPPKASGMSVATFPTAGGALQHILRKSDPAVVGFGEFHQKTGTAATLSALERFSRELLPVIAGRTSDLVVETWVSTGDCGKAEKRVTQNVDKVSERPAETENETVKLIKKAAALGVQPHVMELRCEDYEKLQAEGEVDYLALLELVGRRLGEKAKQAVVFRDSKRAEAKEKGAPAEAAKMVAVYGGAVHNDARPAEMWKSVTFGPDLEKFTSDRYVEIDLYVPEFIEGSDNVKQEKWYPVFEANVSTEKTLVIELDESSYIIVFRKGVANKG